MVAAAVALSACGSSGNSVTGSVNGHNYSASAGQLPSGFPSDVPTPDNSRVLGGGGSGNNWDVAFAVTGKVVAGTTAYRSKLSSAGYTVTPVQAGAASSAAGAAAGATFSATNSKWSIQVAGGTTSSAASEGTLKSGEFALNVTVTPNSGGTS